MDLNKHSIRLVQQCPVCNRQYQPGRVQIIDEQGNTFLAYMTCSFCHSNLIVRVMSLPQGLVGSAILTDLMPDEVLRFADEPGVSTDDILYVHQILHTDELFNYFKN